MLTEEVRKFVDTIVVMGDVDAAFAHAESVVLPDANPITSCRTIIDLCQRVADMDSDEDSVITYFLVAAFLSAVTAGVFKRTLKQSFGKE